MTAGRKPLPKHLRLVTGNAGHRSIDDSTPEPAAARPECPDFLDALAHAEWDRIVPELEVCGLLTKLDMAALAAYCSTFSMWQIAELRIRERALDDPNGAGLMATGPNGFKMFSHWLNVRNKALEQLRAFMAEFGMSPSSRARVKALGAQMPLFGDDPMDAFLRAGQAVSSGGGATG